MKEAKQTSKNGALEGHKKQKCKTFQKIELLASFQPRNVSVEATVENSKRLWKVLLFFIDSVASENNIKLGV